VIVCTRAGAAGIRNAVETGAPAATMVMDN
jgi:hypothetical protein